VRILTLIRRGLEAVLVVYVVGLLGLAAASQVAPAAGYALFAVRSASMTPTLGVGSLVVVQRVEPSQIHVGDVVTISIGSGATVTHRVIGVAPSDLGPVFTTKGDANPTADPVVALSTQLRGRLDLQVPLLGYLLAMLAMPTGVAALFSIGGTLLTAVWLLDEIKGGEEDDELDELRRQVEAAPTSVA
jgi:signal peptidase I